MAPSLGRSAFYLLQLFLIYSCATLVKLKVPAQLFLHVEMPFPSDTLLFSHFSNLLPLLFQLLPFHWLDGLLHSNAALFSTSTLFLTYVHPASFSAFHFIHPFIHSFIHSFIHVHHTLSSLIQILHTLHHLRL